MSEMAKKARAAMKEKAQGRTAPTKGSIDASGWTEPTMNTTAKVGMRPISRRAFKKGGKVEGEAGMKHAGKKPRKAAGGGMSDFAAMAEAGKDAAREAKMRQIIAEGEAPVPKERIDRYPEGYFRAWENRGGRTGRKNGGKALTADSLINRDVKEANEERGYPHVGGYKKGGKTGGKWIQGAIKHPGSLRKALHAKEGENISAKKLEKATHSDNPKLAKRARLAETLRGMHAKGGKVHEDEAMDKKLIKAEMAKHEKNCRCEKCSGGRMGKAEGGANYEGGTRPTGGRIARKSGGRAKGKTNIHINIIAGEKHPEGAPAPMGLPGPLPRPPMPIAPPPLAGGAGMPPMGAPPAPMGGAIPPGAPPPAFKSGGRIGKHYGGGFNNPGAQGMMNRFQMGNMMGRNPMGGGMQYSQINNMPQAAGAPSSFFGASAPLPPGAVPASSMSAPPPSAFAPGGGGVAGGTTAPTSFFGASAPTSSAPAPMVRKSGGRAGHGSYRSYKDMDAGAGGGLGRLEKTEIQKRKG